MKSKGTIMFSIAALLSGICWLLVSVTILIDFAFLKNYSLLSISFNVFSVAFFILGCCLFIYSNKMCKKIKAFENHTKIKLENLSEADRKFYLSKIKKYDFMSENGKLNNWRGVLYCLQMKIPEYFITKSIIDDLQFDDKIEI
jgi:hypothetical protein